MQGKNRPAQGKNRPSDIRFSISKKIQNFHFNSCVIFWSGSISKPTSGCCFRSKTVSLNFFIQTGVILIFDWEQDDDGLV